MIDVREKATQDAASCSGCSGNGAVVVVELRRGLDYPVQQLRFCGACVLELRCALPRWRDGAEP